VGDEVIVGVTVGVAVGVGVGVLVRVTAGGVGVAAVDVGVDVGVAVGVTVFVAVGVWVVVGVGVAVTAVVVTVGVGDAPRTTSGGREISPVTEFKTIGNVALTANVPGTEGNKYVFRVNVPIFPRSKVACLEPSIRSSIVIGSKNSFGPANCWVPILTQPG